MIGRQLDRYRLLEEVGSGGMSVVYKGLDLSLDRTVAVKVLHPHLAGKEESRRRFSREARAVARLRHPAIVEIYDFSGDEAAQSFIVTEFVPGRTLRAFGDEVGFGLPEIGALIAERLAEALEHAHDAGVVHRDLKPENVMVRQDGVLKLMDFGIARMIGKDERMTMTGAMVGSPLHMPPEVIEGREAGASADVFSLGTILYWLVTGKMAFEGSNTTQTLRLILEGRYPDPRLAAPSCSDGLAQVIARCLHRDPAARFAGMAELREALRAELFDAGIEPGDAELRAFFLDPIGRRASLRRHLIETLLVRAEESVAAKRPSRAVSFCDRVLALDESEPRVQALLERLRRRRRTRRLSVAAAIVLAAGCAGMWGLSRVDEPAPAVPASGSGPAAAIEAPEHMAEGPQPETRTAPAVPAPSPAQTPEGSPAATGPADPAPARIAASQAPSPATSPVPPQHKQSPSGAGPDPRRPPAARTDAGRRPADEPRPATRLVQLRWVPQGATLSIDGNPQATVAPSWSGELPVGSHTVQVAHPGCCETWEETIDVEPGEGALQRSVALAPRESGWFEIACDRADAEVWLDGTFKGTVADVNRRGGVAVGFSKNDSGRERYVKTVRFELLAMRDDGARERLASEVTVRAGQRSRTPSLAFEPRPPGGGSEP
ncbi:MAG TPA: protein kinase [Vulgatibacter sp.]